MGLLLADNAVTTLSSGISNSDTILTVISGAGAVFPVLPGTDANFIIITMENASGLRELIKCTFRNGDIFGSVTYPNTRAYGGTTARSWNAGDIVDIRLNAQAFAEISTASSITNVAAGNVVATNVQDAIDELDGDKQVKITASGILKGDGVGGVTAAVSNTDFLPVTSPTMAGTPTAPTAAKGTSSTQVATTAFTRAWGVDIGALQFFAGVVAPTVQNPDASLAWLPCDGTAVSRTTFAALYTYACQGQPTAQLPFGTGDGATTFNVPDMRGHFLRASGTHADGTAAGTFGTKQADSFLNHDHTASSSDAGHVHPFAAYASTIADGTGGSHIYMLSGGSTNTGYGYSSISTTVNASTAGSTETRPDNYACLLCIKT